MVSGARTKKSRTAQSRFTELPLSRSSQRPRHFQTALSSCVSESPELYYQSNEFNVVRTPCQRPASSADPTRQIQEATRSCTTKAWDSKRAPSLTTCPKNQLSIGVWHAVTVAGGH